MCDFDLRVELSDVISFIAYSSFGNVYGRIHTACDFTAVESGRVFSIFNTTTNTRWRTYGKEGKTK